MVIVSKDVAFGKSISISVKYNKDNFINFETKDNDLIFSALVNFKSEESKKGQSGNNGNIDEPNMQGDSI